MAYKWSPKGRQPQIVQKQRRRERVTLFGAVNPINGQVFAKQAQRGNADSFKKFLKKILFEHRNKKGKVWMILDNVRYHHAKKLKPFLENNKDRLELIFLPAYSPDLNPMERIWWYMRKKIVHNRYLHSLANRMKYFWQMFSHYQKPSLFIVNLCNLNFSV